MNNTKKIKKTPRDEEGINDKVKLHDTNLFSGDLQKKTRRASQTAQPPDAGDTYHWKEIKKEKPPYYVTIHIWDGRSIHYNRARVSNGDEDYYVCTVYPEIDLILEDNDITHWSPPKGVIYPKYDPMTAKDLPGYDLKEIIKAMNRLKIYYAKTFVNATQFIESINDCIEIVKRRLKKVSKDPQVNLHNRVIQRTK